MKILGGILTAIGLVTSIVFGIQAINDSESFNFLGLDIVISSANWTPLIISLAVLIIGLVMLKKK